MEEIVALVAIVSTFIGFPLVIVSYLKWKHQAKASGIPLEAAARIEARMDRIEQAIDTVALEVERVAEGQRWLTKVLADPADARGQLQRSDPSRQLDRPAR